MERFVQMTLEQIDSFEKYEINSFIVFGMVVVDPGYLNNINNIRYK